MQLDVKLEGQQKFIISLRNHDTFPLNLSSIGINEMKNNRVVEAAIRYLPSYKLV